MKNGFFGGIVESGKLPQFHGLVSVRGQEWIRARRWGS